MNVWKQEIQRHGLYHRHLEICLFVVGSLLETFDNVSLTLAGRHISDSAEIFLQLLPALKL